MNPATNRSSACCRRARAPPRAAIIIASFLSPNRRNGAHRRALPAAQSAVSGAAIFIWRLRSAPCTPSRPSAETRTALIWFPCRTTPAGTAPTARFFPTISPFFSTASSRKLAGRHRGHPRRIEPADDEPNPRPFPGILHGGAGHVQAAAAGLLCASSWQADPRQNMPLLAFPIRAKPAPA